MRAWGFLRQLMAVMLAALLAAPAYSFEKTPAAIQLHDQASGGVYLKTRVWGSNAKILLHFRAVGPLSEKQRCGCENPSWKTALGSGVTYDYDAFGNLLHSTGTTFNEFLFAGEQFDSDLGLYYNRTRYLNTSTGRFWTMDSYEGDDEAPLSLHKYLYVFADPVNGKDPSGSQDEIDEAAGEAGNAIVDNIPNVNALQTLQNVRAVLTVTAGLGAKVLSDPSVIEEIEGTGEAGIAVVQRSFMQMETVLSEAEAEATSLAENGSRAREIMNQLYTRFPSPNPANIEYHHLVEQGGVNASRFGRALQSFGNIIPLSEDIHQLITNFYSSTSQAWLSNGMSVRNWMATQDWETQWTAGLAIAKEVILTGKITWHP